MFTTLTDKQREVMDLVLDNHTSKEIAWKLGISESAVNQRIESVRTRAGSPPRSELARAYRHYCESGDDLEPDVAASAGPEESARRLDETLRRLALMVAIACGLLLTAFLALGVARLAKIMS